MAYPLVLTWTTLIDYYDAASYPALAPLARAYYARQGRLLTGAGYLALPAALAAQPLLNSPAARALLIAALPTAGPVDETAAQYAARGEARAQPLLTALVAVLAARGITPAEFNHQLAAQGAEAYLPGVLGPDFWTAVAGSWQQQVRYQLDAEGRWQQLLTSQAGDAPQAALHEGYARVLAGQPQAPLETIAALPDNVLARDLWTPRPTADSPALTALVAALQAAAGPVVADNYPDSELNERLLAALPIALRNVAQVLLTPTSGQPAVTSVAELAGNEASEQVTRLLALPANHPVVYALAAGFRAVIQRFLAATTTPAPADPADPLPVRAQLLGVGDSPLPGFPLRLTQALGGPLGGPLGGQRDLGSLVTTADGRFTLSVPRNRYLDEDDLEVEAPADVQVAVYQPGQDMTQPPQRTLPLEPRADNAEITLATDLTLPETIAPVSSAAIAGLADELPVALTQVLADNGIRLLADLRAVGSLSQLATDALAADPTLWLPVRRLEALAQFEVVSPDLDLGRQVVAAGFYSPAQLLDSVSSVEFTARFTAADPTSDALRAQATVFYQQVAAAQALSQTLGLLSTGSVAVAEADATPVRRFGVARFTSLGQVASRGVDDDINNGATAAFGATSGDDTAAPALPGYHLVDGFDPAAPGPLLTPQASGQCDCPTCRSAVSPAAYLTSLLKYASQYLRTDATPATVLPQTLQDQLLQPYCDLTLSCQAAEEPVCQYRLASEIIQAYWRGQSPAGAALRVVQARAYVEGVLDALLQALGTTLAELRATTAATRPALAARLALPAVLVARLKQTFSVDALRDERSLDEVEADLAAYFGLASTAPDPLRTGQLLTPELAANPIRLVRWNLQGLTYGLNTDADGQLCLTVTPAGSEPHVTVYAGQPTEDNVVARGTLLASDAAGQTFAGLLYPQHGSGLSGSLVAAVTGTAAVTFTLAAVPAVTAGRQQVLAAEWLREDASAVALLQPGVVGDSASWNGLAFLVDPDQLGPDDFRVLSSRLDVTLGNRAYQLWRRRYEFLQDQLAVGLLAQANPREGVTTGYYTYSLGLHGEVIYDTVGINLGLLNPQAAIDALTATAQQGGLGKLLDQLTTHSLTYTGDGIHYVRIPWAIGAFFPYENYYQAALTGTQVLAHLYTDCAGNTTATPLATSLLAALGLDTEALRRLYDLWQLSRAQDLTLADLQEAFDIVRQTVKKRFEADWADEEQRPAAGHEAVALDTRLFQTSLHEPQPGVWDLIRTAAFGLSANQLPRLDPDEVTPLDLPDASYADSANQLWSARQAELLVKRQAILASGAGAATAQARADAMLRYAYLADRFGPAPRTVLPGSPPALLTSFEAVVTSAQNTVATNQQAASQLYLDATLALRPAEVTRLAELRAQVLVQPADALWQEMAALLTLGWKRAVAYRQAYVAEGTPAPTLGAAAARTRSWLAQEADVPNLVNSPLYYLIGTRKHRLVKWRADVATRAQWVAALAPAGQRPLLDPDQLVPGDFRQAGERSRAVYSPALAPADKPYLNPAFDLYQRRAAQVTKWYNYLAKAYHDFQGNPNRKALSWQLVADTFNSSQAELEELYRQQQAGVDVAPALRRLQLTPDGLTLLVNQIVGDGTDRWAEVPHLLTQQLRQRQYAAWAREEISLGIVPNPYYFREPQPEAESLATQPWRSSAVERRRWQRALAARFAQAQAASAAQTQAVKAAEDQYLGELRDALLLAKVGSTGDSLATRAAFMEERFLLDFQVACCQHTTRVAQAITVLQQFFANVRGGLASNGLLLSQDDATFEADWQWLGSYERWRSLLFLYLYPQNVLLPALKPGQTSQFKQTVSAIRQAASTSVADARGYMEDYQAYLVDLGSLQVAAVTQTTLNAASTDGFQAAAMGPAVSLQVALSASRRAYANLYYLSSGGATEASFAWTQLPGSALVERIVGSAAYQPASQDRYVYVFALLREDQKDALVSATALYLAFQRFNLQTLTWDTEYTRLGLNDTATLEPLNMQVAAGNDETWPPIVTGLRNRVSPLYTAAPLSLPTYGTGVSTSLSDVIGRIYNVDLFYTALDSQGTSLAEEQTKTFFLVSDLTLLACTRASKSILFYTVAIQVGQLNPTLANCFVIDVTRTSTASYLISSLLNTFLDSTPQQNPGGIGYNTPVFTTGFVFAPFNDFRTRLRLLINGSTASFKLYAELVQPQPNASSSFTYNTPLQLTTNTAEITSLGSQLESSETISVNSYITPLTTFQQGLAIYYAVAGVTAYSLKLFFSATTYQDSLDVNVYVGSSASQVLNSPADAIARQAEVCTYVGPLLRTGMAPITPYLVLGHRQAAATAITLFDGTITRTLAQTLPTLPPLLNSLSAVAQTARRQQLASVHATYVLGSAGFVSTLVSEAYYALPVLLAQELMRGRNYELALHYFRLVYDYSFVTATGTPNAKRLVYPALANAGTAAYDTVSAWLLDPSNPYTLAGLRPNAHLDYVVMSVARCLLAYADDEFTRDTAESVDRARSLYELADRLLQQDITQYAVPGTAALFDPFDALFPAAWLAEWQSLKAVLARVNQRAVLEQVLHLAVIPGTSAQGLEGLFSAVPADGWAAAFDQAWQLVNGQLDALPGGYLSLCAPASSAAATVSYSLSTPLPSVSVRPYVPFLPNTAFCVPTNPVPYALALRAELNLYKIRSCRNIAGVQRELDPYSAATDNTTGLPTLSSTGQLVRSTRLVVPATPFRYAYIVERARNLVALAQQTESALLSALEKRDAEAYNLLKARQDIATNQATVQLQTLRVSEAEDGVDLAGLQLEKSEIMETQYDQWLSEGLNSYEISQLQAITIAAEAKVVAAIASGTDLFGEITSGGGDAVKAAANAVAAVADAAAQINGLQATYQRRAQEWQFQRNLAAQDIKINQQQIRISNDQLKITGQEKRISQLQLDHATAVLNFLTTKFTNAELYDWMSGILQSAYGYFLQQATATARLAEQQLAFERQQVPAGIVQQDYYSDPTDDLTSASVVTSSGGTTDRKGLTGSVRLLEDLTRLDEYAFETTKRKLQLSKTISLAQSFPTEFVRFRDTGIVAFACQPEWFDYDFPGQYLRVLRRVRTSVIALVPPVDGIKARLSTAGTSHVTVDGAPFQTLALPRAQEAVALTSPSNATGLFELDQQSSELLLPFEGLGVDVPWTFAMQPASNPNLDYSAVADVLITLDYSALESADYARQVTQQLGTDRKQQVVLSLRDRFADQWYDLHHADGVAPAQQYVSTLTLTADDLPRSLRGMSVSQVSLFVDAPLDDDVSEAGAFADRSHLELRLTRGAGLGGAAFTNQYGLISTRTGTGSGPLYTGNAGALVSLIGTAPAGDWTLAIGPGRLRDRLASGLVNDIYLILEVEGNVPAYVL